MYRPQQRPMRKQICPKCRGTGKVLHNSVWSFGWKPCGPCKGTGQIEIPIIPQMKQPMGNVFRHSRF